MIAMRIFFSFMMMMILLLLLLCNTLIAQTDLEQEDLKGKIKSISLTVYHSSKKSGKVKLLGISAESTKTYNKAGYLLKNKYRYHTRTFGTGKWKSSSYELMKNNQCAGSVYSEEEEVVQRVENTYERELVKKKMYYDGDDVLIVEEFFTYNAGGKLIEKLVVNADSSIRGKTVITFSKKSKILTRKEWSETVFKIAYSYSYPDLYTIRVNQLDEAGETISYEIETYDKKENLIEAIDYDSKGAITGRGTNEYDKRGNLILRRVFNADGSEQNYNYMRYQYQYDKKNNWIQQVEYLHNGNSLDASEREIIYY
jgi:hypothetical protein